MSKRNRIFLILLLAINIFYLSFILLSKVFDRNHDELPQLSINTDLITISVKDKEEQLLKQVTAYDEEDGDLSDQVFIYDISSFDENHHRTVTYGVFDSNNQLVTASCQLAYRDYVAPRFSSEKSFVNLSMSSDLIPYLHATSVVDGNISNRISVTKSEKDEKMVYQLSVTDSTGTTSTLDITDEINLKAIYSNLEIDLKQYIIYMKAGEKINLYDNIRTVKTGLGENKSLKWEVDIETNYIPKTKGIFEAKYTLNRKNGDFGIAKMIIIVE